MAAEAKKIISPIAIDMGAKNTGVYYAKYKQGASFEDIEKQGQVLVYDKYTALLRDRTANRHVRRGYKRKELAKRLLVLVLENHFGFPAKEHHQAIGFLMNRRGFTFLEEEYSKEHLNNLPNDVWDELSVEIKKILGKKENVADRLEDLAKKKPEKITEIFNGIQDIENYKKIQKLKKDSIYYSYVEKILASCDMRIANTKIKEKKKKLSETSKWIVEKLIKAKVNFLKDTLTDGYQIDLLGYLNSLDVPQAEKLKSQLPDIERELKETKEEIKKSIWDFKFSEFELDKKENILDDENHPKYFKTHLHHFCYAIYKINNEIISGGRHRSKFFGEIKDGLKKIAEKDFLSNENNPKYLKNFITEVNKNSDLGIDNLYKLACHISNFELKPLRAYFNDKTPTKKGGKRFISHRNNDQFDLEKLSRISSTWFMKHWIVNEEKDNADKVQDYKNLRAEWGNHTNKNNIIDFWLNTDPVLTIPPYQSMNNRRPPKCQTLLLNSDYLDKHYSNWKKWLKQLNPNKEYKETLQRLQSGKGTRKTKQGKEIDGRLINDELIQSRQLQFILDTVKKRDKYNLNEIWSIYHQWQKATTTNKKELQTKLDEVIKESDLPDNLKADLTFEKFKQPETFGHFINKYYQTRRKTRDGRYFLIQEKKEKWLTEGKLLTLCPHKPRQKKYQWQIDLAAVLGISIECLKKAIHNQAPEDYFSDIKRACDRAAKAQKNHRGELKIKLRTALYQAKEITKKNKNLAKKKGKGKLSNIDKELSNLANNCDKLKTKLIEKTKIDGLLVDKQSEEKDQKIALVFKFAQIHNIVFKDRNGFSKTCPVCSADNGFRMQENDEGITQASRLPAMSIRLIDGVVMRICDAISRQVANTCWEDIKKDLEQNKKVSIPLIFEQNRFEFEPSLKKIKGKKADEITDNRDEEYKTKDKRIKDAAKGISAYSGNELGEDGEIDHIIPQASKYGTLNDEANLIYLSNEDNQNKREQSKFLSNLHKNYTDEIFGEESNDKIKQFIYDELEGKGETATDKDSDNFTFGRYLSFINLNEKQQRAFRHALFLQDSDPLKQKVINALQNRNRAIVNGTQRYLAQCVADKLYKKAKCINKEKQIKFDYFEYTARQDDPKSTYNLRKEYGIEKPKKQPLYSHLVDAQLAFLIASEDHKNDGTMGIKFRNNQTIWKNEVDKQTGEVLPSKSFNVIDIGANDLIKVALNRKKSEEGVRLHRSFHRPNFYAQNYVPIFLGRKNDEIEVRAGFSWENSVEIKTKKKNILSILPFAKNKEFSSNSFESLEDLYNSFAKKIKHNDYEIFYIAWDKVKIHQHFVKEFSNKDITDGKKWNDIVEFLTKLSYRVQKQKITELQDIKDVLNNIEIGKSKQKRYFDIKLFGKTIELPAKNEWLYLLKEWRESNQEFDAFIKEHFARKENQITIRPKVRKVFSLPVVNNLGHFLQKRKSWNGQDIYQISADSDSRKDGNKFSRKVRTDEDLKEVINSAFISKNTFKLEQKKGIVADGNYDEIDPNKWFEIKNSSDFPNGIDSIFYKIDNTTRPQVKIHLSNDDNEINIESILESPLTKAKDKKKLRDELENEECPVILEYTANNFNEEIIKELLKVLK